jgi:hypothetical protein
MRRVYRRIAPENVEVRPLAGSNMLGMQGTTFDFWIFQMCRARRTLLLRGSTRLARLLAECARRTEAYDELAKVCGSFTEGFETVDFPRGQSGVLVGNSIRLVSAVESGDALGS